ncbi:hypothetical protein DID80_00970 [Candidatus Marinamargulisbacteria bacterium SCGC AAA071-K20]|nr:hypothetical protein DID80_00970 [Candidatus Marinamargulisbacteria bacterium SCGC AAA071-K20]
MAASETANNVKISFTGGDSIIKSVSEHGAMTMSEILAEHRGLRQANADNEIVSIDLLTNSYLEKIHIVETSESDLETHLKEPVIVSDRSKRKWSDLKAELTKNISAEKECLPSQIRLEIPGGVDNKLLSALYSPQAPIIVELSVDPIIVPFRFNGINSGSFEVSVNSFVQGILKSASDTQGTYFTTAKITLSHKGKPVVITINKADTDNFKKIYHVLADRGLLGASIEGIELLDLGAVRKLMAPEHKNRKELDACKAQFAGLESVKVSNGLKPNGRAQSLKIDLSDPRIRTKGDLRTVILSGMTAVDTSGDSVTVSVRYNDRDLVLEIPLSDTLQFEEFEKRVIAAANKTVVIDNGQVSARFGAADSQSITFSGSEQPTVGDIVASVVSPSSVDFAESISYTTIKNGKTHTVPVLPDSATKTLPDLARHVRNDLGYHKASKDIGFVINGDKFDITRVYTVADLGTLSDTLLSTIVVQKIVVSNKVMTDSVKQMSTNELNRSELKRKQRIFGELANHKLVISTKDAPTVFAEFNSSVSLGAINGVKLEDHDWTVDTQVEQKLHVLTSGNLTEYATIGDEDTDVSARRIKKSDSVKTIFGKSSSQLLQLQVAPAGDIQNELRSKVNGSEIAFVNRVVADDGSVTYSQSIFTAEMTDQLVGEETLVGLGIVAAANVDVVAEHKEVSALAMLNKKVVQAEDAQHFMVPVMVVPKSVSLSKKDLVLMKAFNVSLAKVTDDRTRLSTALESLEGASRNLKLVSTVFSDLFKANGEAPSQEMFVNAVLEKTLANIDIELRDLVNTDYWTTFYTKDFSQLLNLKSVNDLVRHNALTPQVYLDLFIGDPVGKINKIKLSQLETVINAKSAPFIESQNGLIHNEIAEDFKAAVLAAYQSVDLFYNGDEDSVLQSIINNYWPNPAYKCKDSVFPARMSRSETDEAVELNFTRKALALVLVQNNESFKTLLRETKESVVGIKFEGEYTRLRSLYLASSTSKREEIEDFIERSYTNSGHILNEIVGEFRGGTATYLSALDITQPEGRLKLVEFSLLNPKHKFSKERKDSASKELGTLFGKGNNIKIKTGQLASLTSLDGASGATALLLLAVSDLVSAGVFDDVVSPLVSLDDKKLLKELRSNTGKFYKELLKHKDEIIRAVKSHSKPGLRSDIVFAIASAILSSDKETFSLLGQTINLNVVRPSLANLFGQRVLSIKKNDRESDVESTLASLERRVFVSKQELSTYEIQLDQLEKFRDHVTFLSDTREAKVATTFQILQQKMDLETKKRVANYKAAESLIKRALWKEFSALTRWVRVAGTEKSKIDTLAKKAAQYWLLTGNMHPNIFQELNTASFYGETTISESDSLVSAQNLSRQLMTLATERRMKTVLPEGALIQPLNLVRLTNPDGSLNEGLRDVSLGYLETQITVPAGKKAVFIYDRLDGEETTYLTKPIDDSNRNLILGTNVVVSDVRFVDVLEEDRTLTIEGPSSADVKVLQDRFVKVNTVAGKQTLVARPAPGFDLGKSSIEVTYNTLKADHEVAGRVFGITADIQDFDTLMGSSTVRNQLDTSIDFVENKINLKQTTLTAAVTAFKAEAGSQKVVTSESNGSTNRKGWSGFQRAMEGKLLHVAQGRSHTAEKRDIPVKVHDKISTHFSRNSVSSVSAYNASLQSVEGVSISEFLPGLLASSGSELTFKIESRPGSSEVVKLSDLPKSARFYKSAAGVITYKDRTLSYTKTITAINIQKAGTRVANDETIFAAFRTAISPNKPNLSQMISTDSFKDIYNEFNRTQMVAVFEHPVNRSRGQLQDIILKPNLEFQIRRNAIGQFEMLIDGDWHIVSKFVNRTVNSRSLNLDVATTNQDRQSQKISKFLKQRAEASGGQIKPISIRELKQYYLSLESSGADGFSRFSPRFKFGTQSYSDDTLLSIDSVINSNLIVKEPTSAEFIEMPGHEHGLKIEFISDESLEYAHTIDLTESTGVPAKIRDADGAVIRDADGAVQLTGAKTSQVIDLSNANKVIAHIRKQANQFSFGQPVWVVINHNDTLSQVSLESLSSSHVAEMKFVYVGDKIADTELYNDDGDSSNLKETGYLDSKVRIERMVYGTGKFVLSKTENTYRNESGIEARQTVRVAHKDLALELEPRNKLGAKYRPIFPMEYKRSLDPSRKNHEKLMQTINAIQGELTHVFSGNIEVTPALDVKRALLARDKSQNNVLAVVPKTENTLSRLEGTGGPLWGDGAVSDDDEGLMGVKTRKRVLNAIEIAPSQGYSSISPAGDSPAQLRAANIAARNVVQGGSIIGAYVSGLGATASVSSNQIADVQSVLSKMITHDRSANLVTISFDDHDVAIKAELLEKLRALKAKDESLPPANKKLTSIDPQDADESNIVRLKLFQATLLNAGYAINMADNLEILYARFNVTQPATPVAPTVLTDDKFNDILIQGGLTKPERPSRMTDEKYIELLQSEVSKRFDIAREFTGLLITTVAEANTTALVAEVDNGDRPSDFTYELASKKHFRDLKSETIEIKEKLDQIKNKKIRHYSALADVYKKYLQEWITARLKLGIASEAITFPQLTLNDQDTLAEKVKKCKQFADRFERVALQHGASVSSVNSDFSVLGASGRKILLTNTKVDLTTCNALSDSKLQATENELATDLDKAVSSLGIARTSYRDEVVNFANAELIKLSSLTLDQKNAVSKSLTTGEMHSFSKVNGTKAVTSQVESLFAWYNSVAGYGLGKYVSAALKASRDISGDESYYNQAVEGKVVQLLDQNKLSDAVTFISAAYNDKSVDIPSSLADVLNRYIESLRATIGDSFVDRYQRQDMCSPNWINSKSLKSIVRDIQQKLIPRNWISRNQKKVIFGTVAAVATVAAVVSYSMAHSKDNADADFTANVMGGIGQIGTDVTEVFWNGMTAATPTVKNVGNSIIRGFTNTNYYWDNPLEMVPEAVTTGWTDIMDYLGRSEAPVTVTSVNPLSSELTNTKLPLELTSLSPNDFWFDSSRQCRSL